MKRQEIIKDLHDVYRRILIFNMKQYHYEFNYGEVDCPENCGFFDQEHTHQIPKPDYIDYEMEFRKIRSSRELHEEELWI